MRFDVRELPAVVELVEVEARHLVLMLVIEGRAGRPHREEFTERRADRALPPHLKMTVKNEPARQARARFSKLVRIPKSLDERLQLRRRIMDGVMDQDHRRTRFNLGMRKDA